MDTPLLADIKMGYEWYLCIYIFFLLSYTIVSADRLKLLLSFAVGGLLGDVFLHLLPEAYGPIKEGKQKNDHSNTLKM